MAIAKKLKRRLRLQPKEFAMPPEVPSEEDIPAPEDEEEPVEEPTTPPPVDFPTKTIDDKTYYDIGAIAEDTELAKLFKEWHPRGEEIIRSHYLSSLPTMEKDGQAFYDFEEITKDPELTKLFMEWHLEGKEIIGNFYLSTLPTTEKDGQTFYNLEAISKDPELTALFETWHPKGKSILIRYLTPFVELYNKAIYKARAEGISLEEAVAEVFGVSAEEAKRIIKERQEYATYLATPPPALTPEQRAQIAELEAEIATLKPQVQPLVDLWEGLWLQVLQMFDPSRTSLLTNIDPRTGDYYRDQDGNIVYVRTHWSVYLHDIDGNPTEAWQTILDNPALLEQYYTLVNQTEFAANQMHQVSNYMVALQETLTNLLEGRYWNEEKGIWEVIEHPSLFDALLEYRETLAEHGGELLEQKEKVEALATPELSTFVKDDGSFDLPKALEAGIPEDVLTELGFTEDNIEVARAINALDEYINDETGAVDIAGAYKAGLILELRQLGFTDEDFYQANAIAYLEEKGFIITDEEGNKTIDILAATQAGVPGAYLFAVGVSQEDYYGTLKFTSENTQLPTGEWVANAFLAAHTQIPSGEWFENTTLEQMQIDNPELYTILTTEGFDAYSVEIEKIQAKYDEFIATHTEIEPDVWFANEELKDIKTSTPELYGILTDQGYDAYIAELDKIQAEHEATQAILAEIELYKGSPLTEYVPGAIQFEQIGTSPTYDLGAAIAAGYDPDKLKQIFPAEIVDALVALDMYAVPGGYDIVGFLKTTGSAGTQVLENAGFDKAVIEASLIESQAPTPEVKEPTLWSQITPWEEEKGVTFLDFISGYYIWGEGAKGKKPPTQKELAKIYEAEQKALQEGQWWQNLLFGQMTVVKTPDGTYAQVMIGEPPLISPAKGIGALGKWARRGIFKPAPVSAKLLTRIKVLPKPSLATVTELGKAKAVQALVREAQAAARIREAAKVQQAMRGAAIRSVIERELAKVAATAKVAPKPLPALPRITVATIPMPWKPAQRIWAPGIGTIPVFAPSPVLGDITSYTIQPSEVPYPISLPGVVPVPKPMITPTGVIVSPDVMKAFKLTPQQLQGTQALTKIQIQQIAQTTGLTLAQVETMAKAGQLTKALAQVKPETVAQVAARTMPQTWAATKGLAQTLAKTLAQAKTMAQVKPATRPRVQTMVKGAVSIKPALARAIAPAPAPYPYPYPAPYPYPYPYPMPSPATSPAPAPVSSLAAPRPVRPIPPAWPLMGFEEPKAEPEKGLEFPAGTITWKHGLFWKVIPPPYDVKRPINLKRPPKGVHKFATGEGSAYKTIQVIGGIPPKDVDVDLGWVDVHIRAKDGHVTIDFKAGGEETIVGESIPSTTKGITIKRKPEHRRRREVYSEKPLTLSEAIEERPARKISTARPRRYIVKEDTGLDRYYRGKKLPEPELEFA